MDSDTSISSMIDHGYGLAASQQHKVDNQPWVAAVYSWEYRSSIGRNFFQFTLGNLLVPDPHAHCWCHPTLWGVFNVTPSVFKINQFSKLALLNIMNRWHGSESSGLIRQTLTHLRTREYVMFGEEYYFHGIIISLMSTCSSKIDQGFGWLLPNSIYVER